MHAGLLALSLLAATLSAEPAGDEATRLKVQGHLKQAAGLFKSGDYQGALGELKAVDEVQELGGVRFNIARCLEELDRPAEAIKAFERYLKTPDGTPTAAVQQKRAKEAIARLEPLVFGSASVRCTPEGVQLRIVGVTESAIACGSYPRVEAGTYQVIATLAGYKQATAELTVAAGEQVELAIALERAGPGDDKGEPGAEKKKLVGALTVSGTPAGSAVAVTHGVEKLTGALPWAARDLVPGTYRVEVGRLGERGIARDVQVAPGQETRIQVALATAEDEDLSEEKKQATFAVTTVPLGTPAAPSKHRAPDESVSASAPLDGKRVGGIVAVAVGGASLITSGILALAGNGKKGEIQKGGLASGQAIQAAASSGTSLFNGALATMVVGIAAAGTGVVLIVVSGGGDSAKVALSPAALPSGAGVAVSGTFP
jgi:hypothetical protein